MSMAAGWRNPRDDDCRAWAALRNPLCQLTAGSGCTERAASPWGGPELFWIETPPL